MTSLLLMNCTRCDDVLKIVETARHCECGAAIGRITHEGEPHVTAAARILTIDWEAYDGIGEGESRPFGVLPLAQYRGRGA